VSRLTLSIETNAPLTALFFVTKNPTWPEVGSDIVGLGSCVLYTETTTLTSHMMHNAQDSMILIWLDDSITEGMTVYVFGIGISVPETTAKIKDGYYEYEYNAIKGVPDTDWGGW
jgi:hypothetical protein